MSIVLSGTFALIFRYIVSIFLPLWQYWMLLSPSPGRFQSFLLQRNLMFIASFILHGANHAKSSLGSCACICYVAKLQCTLPRFVLYLYSISIYISIYTANS